MTKPFLLPSLLLVVAPGILVTAQTLGAQQHTPTIASPANTPLPAGKEDIRHPVAPAEHHLVRIETLSADRQTMTVVTPSGAVLTIYARARDLREQLGTVKAGDVVHVETATDVGDRVLTRVTAARVTTSSTNRILILLLSLLLVLGVARVLLGKRANTLVLGADGRYSKSKFQMTVWFVTLITTYVATLILRATNSKGMQWGGIDLPQNLLLISGLSALSFAGAKGITTSKIERRVLEKTRPAKPRFPGDLLYDDEGRHADLGDFQMLVLTGLATVTYLAGVFSWLGHAPLSGTVGLPNVDTTILGAFGLGQGAYLAKKALETETKPDAVQPAATTAKAGPQ